jgi:hypothetical protein
MSNEVNLFELVDKEYIRPEIERRKANGGLPDNFQVRECLIKLPGDRPPLIYFNEEFGWSVKPKLAPGIEMEIGQAIYLHEVMDIEEVLPPTVDDKRVTFIYLFWNGHSYSIVVDPYHPVFSDHPFDAGEFIAAHLRNHFKEMAVKNAKFVNGKLREIGLWPITALLPNPISKIVERVGEGKPEEARQVLVEHCDLTFLTEQLVQTWHPITAFRERMQFFDDALFNHQNKRFHGSTSILIGQIEGAITDWLFEVAYYTTDGRRSLQQKISDFRDALTQIPDLLWLYREARDSMFDFLENGPWLQQFDKWYQPINTSFPGRHVVQHGKYVPDIHTEENSIKLFLLLDTICQFMMFYEVRVLGRDLGQNAEKNEE